jgi:hypothetical protein
MAARAYVDEDVRLPGGRALIEPMVIAKLIQLLAIRDGDRVLVVGGGAGYAAAVAARCGAPIPPFLHEMFEGLEHTEENHKLFAMNVLSHQITRLRLEGVDHFHFYTLNETLLTKQICRWLQIGL